MSKRKLAIAAGALIVVIGGAAAIAAVGHREGRMGHRGMMDGMDHFAQGPGMGQGMDHGMGEGRRGRGFMRGQGGEEGEHGMGRGWRRSMSADDFDARTRERFARIDKNSDGVIDAAEVEAAIASFGEGRGRRFGDRMRQRMQGRFDADRDGKISRQEVLDRVRRDFQRMDLDRDGRITDADLPPMMRGRDVLKGGGPGMGMRGGMGGGMLGRLMAADANKDGVVTVDEALAEATKRFDLADRNKDGVIDATDHDAMRKEMTDYRVRRFLHSHGAGPDGKLTREQFHKSAKERFAEMDVNNDGRIDRQDRGGGRGMMGHGKGPGGEPGDGPGRGGPGGPGMRDGGPPR